MFIVEIIISVPILFIGIVFMPIVYMNIVFMPIVFMDIVSMPIVFMDKVAHWRFSFLSFLPSSLGTLESPVPTRGFSCC